MQSSWGTWKVCLSTSHQVRALLFCCGLVLIAVYLAGRGFKITYGTPKTEGLSLFRLGERTYDHVIFFPIKAKGMLGPYSPSHPSCPPICI